MLITTNNAPADVAAPSEDRPKDTRLDYTISRDRAQAIIDSPAYKADQEYAGYVHGRKRRKSR